MQIGWVTILTTRSIIGDCGGGATRAKRFDLFLVSSSLLFEKIQFWSKILLITNLAWGRNVSRSVALTIGIVIGFVALGIVGAAVLVIFPYEQVLAPTATIVPTPTVTPSPTFPRFLPTASLVTPTPEPPTPTGTRLPTVTPRPTMTPVPTRVLLVATISVPSPTPTADTTAAPVLLATSAPRFYTVSFEADESVIDSGDCTKLRWQASGSVILRLDGQPAERAGQRRVCPRNDTVYTLEFQVAGSAQVQRTSVTIEVNK